MTAKEYLNEVKRDNQRVECKIERIQRLQDLRSRITSVLTQDKVFSSGDQDKIGTLTAQILDLEVELVGELLINESKHNELEKLLSKSCDDVEYKVMYKRYILDKSFAQIGRELGYTRQGVFKIHDGALQKINSKELTFVDKS